MDNSDSETESTGPVVFPKPKTVVGFLSPVMERLEIEPETARAIDPDNSTGHMSQAEVQSHGYVLVSTAVMSEKRLALTYALPKAAPAAASTSFTPSGRGRGRGKYTRS